MKMWKNNSLLHCWWNNNVIIQLKILFSYKAIEHILNPVLQHFFILGFYSKQMNMYIHFYHSYVYSYLLLRQHHLQSFS